MAEYSFPWDGTTLGDCGPYSSNYYDDLYRCAFTTDQHAGEGIIRNLGDELMVTGTSSPITVGSGAAFVNGKFYRNTASISVDIPTPTTGTRIDRIVLRSDFSTQTVRVARIAGSEGGGVPALTQSDGVTWEISLAQVQITTAGVITITDERQFCHFGTAVDSNMLDDAAVTNSKIADGAVSNSKLDDTVKRMKGEIIMWSGALSDHYPIDPDTGAANTHWHICNGEVENGVQTPDLRDKFVIAQGSSFSKGNTGGSTTKNLAHTHGVGTLSNDTVASHAHQLQGNTGESTDIYIYDMTVTGYHIEVPLATHTHPLSGYTVGAGSHTHTISGATASAGSASQDIMPPYYCLIFLCYVG